MMLSRSQTIQARWSGEAARIPLDDLKLDLASPIAEELNRKPGGAAVPFGGRELTIRAASGYKTPPSTEIIVRSRNSTQGIFLQ